MLAVALLLVYVGESSARAVREARISRMKINSETAYFAAEAGFNRVRARIVGGGTSAQIADLHQQGETLLLAGGGTAGRYSLEVSVLSEAYGVYKVKSTGYFGEGTKYAAKRELAGVISLICPSVWQAPRWVVTDYVPFPEPYPSDPPIPPDPPVTCPDPEW